MKISNNYNNSNFLPSMPQNVPKTFIHESHAVTETTIGGDIEAKCLDITAAEPILLSDDDFIKNLSDFDCQMRIQSHFPNYQVQNGEWKKEYANYTSKQILDWQPEEEARINDLLQRVKPKLAKYKITLPKTINFVKTIGKEEMPGTLAYCRKNTIVVCNLDCMDEDLLIHELFHIHSQVDPENRRQLYKLIGFHACNPIQLPDTLAQKRIVNPDSPLLNAYVEVKYGYEKVDAIPFDIYDSTRTRTSGNGGSNFLGNHVFHRFIAVKASNDNDGNMVFSNDAQSKPLVFDLNEGQGFKEQIGNNTTYTDSPEEIIADNFKIMINGGDAKTPDLIEKMKKIFAKTVPETKKLEKKLPEIQPIAQPKPTKADPKKVPGLSQLSIQPEIKQPDETKSILQSEPAPVEPKKNIDPQNPSKKAEETKKPAKKMNKFLRSLAAPFIWIGNLFKLLFNVIFKR